MEDTNRLACTWAGVSPLSFPPSAQSIRPTDIDLRNSQSATGAGTFGRCGLNQCQSTSWRDGLRSSSRCSARKRDVRDVRDPGLIKCGPRFLISNICRRVNGLRFFLASLLSYKESEVGQRGHRLAESSIRSSPTGVWMKALIWPPTD